MASARGYWERIHKKNIFWENPTYIYFILCLAFVVVLVWAAWYILWVTPLTFCSHECGSPLFRVCDVYFVGNTRLTPTTYCSHPRVQAAPTIQGRRWYPGGRLNRLDPLSTAQPWWLGRSDWWWWLFGGDSEDDFVWDEKTAPPIMA